MGEYPDAFGIYLHDDDEGAIVTLSAVVTRPADGDWSDHPEHAARVARVAAPILRLLATLPAT